MFDELPKSLFRFRGMAAAIVIAWNKATKAPAPKSANPASKRSGQRFTSKHASWAGFGRPNLTTFDEVELDLRSDEEEAIALGAKAVRRLNNGYLM